MDSYGEDDFLSYYGDSWIVSPATGVEAKVRRVHGGEVEFSDGSRCKLADINWEHVRPPELGFRHTLGGKILYYITRRPVRARQKGVTAGAIEIQVPAMVRACAEVLGRVAPTLLDASIASLIFNPKFLSLERACSRLRTSRSAVGFAVSHYWAVSLGFDLAQVFVLYYKGLPAASSADGSHWEFVDADCEKTFKREFLC